MQPLWSSRPRVQLIGFTAQPTHAEKEELLPASEATFPGLLLMFLNIGTGVSRTGSGWGKKWRTCSCSLLPHFTCLSAERSRVQSAWMGIMLMKEEEEGWEAFARLGTKQPISCAGL
ncbi:unnamed protein product [Pleuronectes platessa]|uniref:Uncharacterized protein n=1 Tax=Pleuronectes platessa TaxID=8262 RepID=A0A9N7TK34_PLEPL|nr:unnamed protein product [Pleuronectes platessa]